MNRPICYCNNCGKHFTERVSECPDCGEDSWVIDIYYCPFCDVKMDYADEYSHDEGVMCGECDFYYKEPEDTIEFFKGCLKKYDQRKGGGIDGKTK